MWLKLQAVLKQLLFTNVKEEEDSYSAFRCAIETREELPKAEVLKINLIEEADAKTEKSVLKGQGSALYTKETKSKWEAEIYKPE